MSKPVVKQKSTYYTLLLSHFFLCFIFKSRMYHFVTRLWLYNCDDELVVQTKEFSKKWLEIKMLTYCLVAHRVQCTTHVRMFWHEWIHNYNDKFYYDTGMYVCLYVCGFLHPKWHFQFVSLEVSNINTYMWQNDFNLLDSRGVYNLQ